MAEASTPTSRIEAVNSIIASVGEPPANSVDAPARSAVLLAASSLDEASRMIQSKGWFWNKEREVPLTADSSGYFNIPANALRVKVSDVSLNYLTRYYIHRNGKLYNSKDRTYVFTVGSTVKVDMVYLHPFEELPEPARFAIWSRAGVIFQARHLGGETLYNFTEGAARAAFGQILENETEVMRWNITEGQPLFDLTYRR